MSKLNTNIPYIRCFIRNSYIFSDFTIKELTDCYIFGAKAIINKPLLFHCQLNNGAVFWSLPLSAFCMNDKFDVISENENARLSMLQWWDMQGNDITATVFTYLQGADVDLRRRDKSWVRGKYLFTIDDYYADNNSLPSGYAIDSDSKCFHVIKGSDGNIYAYPNNFLRWHNLNFVDEYNKDDIPKYKPISLDIKCEFISDM